jgi:FkbM family methyltransferase
MHLHKVAVIFDNQVRSDTTGGYCLRALKQLVDVEHFLPSDLERVPRRGFDLYLNVDDGLEYAWPLDLRPCAYWAIDTHLNLPWYLKRAQDFDFVFAAQRDGAQSLRRAGITSARWLPLACDREMHAKQSVEKTFDVSFVGHVFPGPRAELLALIQKRFPQSFIGQRFFEGMALTYSASRIVFNRSIRNDINMRVFEALACGSLLITNDLNDNGQGELFQDGTHLVAYRDAAELVEKIDYYLAHEGEREQIAAAGRAEALTKHTYRHRMQRLLEEVQRQSSTAIRVEGSVPVVTPETSPAHTPHGLTSIVILTHNELPYTRRCVESIRRHTPELHELILVDNASTDGTTEYLRGLDNASMIFNTENRGFPAAANQGIRQARGSQVLLLNNDTIVTPGWLDRLLRALHSDPQVGLAGPCSNFVSGEQQVATDYQDEPGLQAFAADWARRHDGERQETDRLVGFCFLIRRDVIERIGLLDERFGIGCFEDDDYTRRALAAGYRALIVRDSFVHHFGGRTFIKSGVDFAALMSRNQALFNAKWEGNEPTHQDSHVGPVAVVPEEAKTDLELSLCMIVRDSARTLRACLEGIRPWVDEMIVVDTGSTDGTHRIAAELGAKVFHFPWCDSFSAARNESLRHARGRWIFWMDADDVIDPINGCKLRELAKRDGPPDLLGYVMQVHCPGPGQAEETDLTIVDHVKLFRNRPELRFEGRIHEQILPAIRRAGGTVAWTDVFVVHAGYDHSAEGQEKKVKRDLHLLHLELDEQPDHPFTLFNLGMTYADQGDHAAAVGFLERSITQAGPDESHLRKAYALLVHSHARLGNAEQARDACARGLMLFPKDAELRFRKALLLQEAGQLDEAARAYHELLANPDERHFTSVDRGIAGFKARQNLAVVYADLGDHLQAEAQWRHVVADVPQYRAGWQGLGEALLAQRKCEDVSEVARRLKTDERLRLEGMILTARLAEVQGKLPEARAELEQAVNEFANEAEALHALCRLCFNHGDPQHALGWLEELSRRCPEDASVRHNLGLIHIRLHQLERAARAFQESLRLRPGYPPSLALLRETLQALGQRAQADATDRQIERLDEKRTSNGQPHTVSTQVVPRARETRYTLQLSDRTVVVPFATRGLVDLAILCEVWIRDVYGVRGLIGPPATVIDIGAHIGAFARMAAEAWPAARIIACEPNPENFALLGRNLAGVANVVGLPVAVVGEDVPEVDFHAIADKVAANSGGGSCARSEPDAVLTRVRALSVERLWREQGITTCDLLKLDCEGSEIPILRALAAAGLLSTVGHIVGEWHAEDRSLESRQQVMADLETILKGTHLVRFRAYRGGREGHFTATPLSEADCSAERGSIPLPTTGTSTAALAG